MVLVPWVFLLRPLCESAVILIAYHSGASMSEPLDYRNPKHVDDQAANPVWKRVLVWSIVGLVALAVIASVSFPFGSTRRELAKRIMCASNLRRIGQAVLLYANANQGQLPPSLPELLWDGTVTPGTLVCQSSDLTESKAPTTQQQVDEILAGDHLSYVWAAEGLKTINDLQPDVVVAFDFERHRPRDSVKTTGMNVLTGDGIAIFVDESDAKAIRAQYFAGVRPVRVPKKLLPVTTQSIH